MLINKYLAVHGGISPDLKKLDNFEKIDRFQEPPTSGLFCDLLWADPLDDASAIEEDYIDNVERE